MKTGKTLLSIDQIRERLSPLYEDKGLRLVLLFGSVASQSAHAGSDVDLAFLFDTPTEILSLTNRVSRLLQNDNVDVVDLAHASPLLRYAAARTGKVLYEREPGGFAAFYSLAFRMYVDTKKLRDAREETIRKFLSARGVT